MSAIAYETVTSPAGGLPLLAPMSEVAGRMAVQEGAKYLEKLYGGRGLLLGGVPGVAPAKVVILGGGIVGINAAKMAAGMGAMVTILDVSLERMRYLSDVMPANVTCIYSNRHNILEQIRTADLVVGGVLIPGAKAPKLIRRDYQFALSLVGNGVDDPDQGFPENYACGSRTYMDYCNPEIDKLIRLTSNPRGPDDDLIEVEGQTGCAWLPWHKDVIFTAGMNHGGILRAIRRHRADDALMLLRVSWPRTMVSIFVITTSFMTR